MINGHARADSGAIENSWPTRPEATSRSPPPAYILRKIAISIEPPPVFSAAVKAPGGRNSGGVIISCLVITRGRAVTETRRLANGRNGRPGASDGTNRPACVRRAASKNVYTYYIYIQRRNKGLLRNPIKMIKRVRERVVYYIVRPVKLNQFPLYILYNIYAKCSEQPETQTPVHTCTHTPGQRFFCNLL